MPNNLFEKYGLNKREMASFWAVLEVASVVLMKKSTERACAALNEFIEKADIERVCAFEELAHSEMKTKAKYRCTECGKEYEYEKPLELTGDEICDYCGAVVTKIKKLKQGGERWIF